MKYLCKGLQGLLLVGDKGYLSKELKEELAQMGILFQTGLRKGMKALATFTYHANLRLKLHLEELNSCKDLFQVYQDLLMDISSDML